MNQYKTTTRTVFPLKFKPRLMERIWGGVLLGQAKGKGAIRNKCIGESWEISAIKGDISIVSNQQLKGNSIQDLIEIYMGDLVGEKVYERYGLEFPLLIKFIDSSHTLSIQVHPDDAIAKDKHSSYGKTEMWYVMDSQPDSYIYIGFKENITRQQYEEAVKSMTLPSILNKIKVKKGDTFFIPAGTIHAIGSGILLAEIQQTSDITYRIYDWDRLDNDGNPRQLHVELAEEAIDFNRKGGFDITPVPEKNRAVEVISCDYFTSNIIALDGTLERDYSDKDSFLIYICTEGEVTVETDGGVETLKALETLLIPAEENRAELSGKGNLIEVFIQ